MNFYSLIVLAWFLASKVLPNVRAAETTIIGSWLEWSPWTTCTENIYCLEGTKQRRRQCENNKHCVGIEEESEGCPNESCRDHPVFQDMAYSGQHSFIHEECSRSVKYYAKGKYAFILQHNITHIFPKAKDVIDNSFFNVKFTKKELQSEQNIFKYCFEPTSRTLTLNEFMNFFSMGLMRFKYATICRPLPKPQEARYVTGFVIGVQESGDLYGIYAQVTTEKGFKSIHYKHMPGFSPAYNLIW